MQPRPQKMSIHENRFYVALSIILGLTALLCVRLWYVQVFKKDYYQDIANANRFRRIDLSASRGVFYDREGELLLGNRPFFDLVIIPQYASGRDKTLESIAALLSIPKGQLEKRLRIYRGQPSFLPVVLKRNLTDHEVGIVQSNKILLPGVDVLEESRRDYGAHLPPHLFGYLGEIDQGSLKKMQAARPDQKYQAGDLIGRQGLEQSYESFLRGMRGEQYVQVDAFGRRINTRLSKEESLSIKPARPGGNIVTTISKGLQEEALKAFKGKNGSVIVLDPRNGELLTMVSEPGYDPQIYQDGMSQDEWQDLTSNPFHPLLDKTTGGLYSPGSLFKALVALAALEEKVITTGTAHYCPGHFKLGNKVIHCHERKGHGNVNVFGAIMHSCDVFFYNVGIELGIDRIAKYARDFGLGEKLNLGINMELGGLIPTSAWKKSTLGLPWTAGDTPNVAIGQGFLSMTPIQMASLYSTIANEGQLFQPRIVRKIVNYVGETVFQTEPTLLGRTSLVTPESYRIIKQALREVVMNPNGTGKRSQVEGHDVAGKTGTVQVTSLGKNKTKLDVSTQWREHAMFAAFSPVDKPEIVVLVVSEHDAEGGGGRAAAPIAGKIISAYWKLKELGTTAPLSSQTPRGAQATRGKVDARPPLVLAPVVSSPPTSTQASTPTPAAAASIAAKPKPQIANPTSKPAVQAVRRSGFDEDAPDNQPHEAQRPRPQEAAKPADPSGARL